MTRLRASHPAVKAALAAQGESDSDLERALFTYIQQAGLPDPEAQYAFDPTRKWRLDFAWPDLRIGAECHGGTWTGGRHVTGSGFEADREKMNGALLSGWRVFEFTAGMIEHGQAIEILREAFGLQKL
jgi:hypothetical protein